jgi:hypothetical protein
VQTVEVSRNVGMGEGGLRPLTAKPYEALWGNGSTVMVDTFFKVTAFVGGEGIRGVTRAAAAAEGGVVVLDPDSMLAAQLKRRGETAVQCPAVGWEFSGDAVFAFRSLFVDDAIASGGGGRLGGGELTFARFVSRVRHAVHSSTPG